MTHVLKTIPAYWDLVAAGDKTFEVRKNDRKFKVGDTVTLVRTIDSHAFVDVPALHFRIRYILAGGQFGIEPGYVVLQLEATNE